MKKSFFTTILLLSAGLFLSCKKENNLYQNVCYVVGYDGTREADTRNGTAKSGGYLFISEDMKDSLLANNRIPVAGKYVIGNLLDGLFDFPSEIMPQTNCGFAFFRKYEEYRFAYKVQISYIPMTEKEESDVPRLIICDGPQSDLHLKFKPIIIKSISKFNKT